MGGGRTGPLAELLAMRERLTQFLEVRVERAERAPTAADAAPWSPVVDAVEQGGVFSVTVEVPGVDAGDLRVYVRNNALMIEGERTIGALRGKGAGAALISVERATGAFQRVIPLRDPVRRGPKAASAVLSNGVLRVEVATAPAESGGDLAVKVESVK